MAFDAQALWDLTGPITMPAMSDDDFLMLLEKQMQAAHPTSGTGDQQSYSSMSTNPLGAPPSAIMAPPPPPAHADSLTPPLTEESSPSPPASFNDTTVGDSSKRKAGRDDQDGPPSKVQHKDADDGVNSQSRDEAAKKPVTRRKSGGGTNAEGDRLAKRKEQNRAAQRAFRDRKEKHVKDLEDKISELEQKFNTSESENTNLKDLLRRLQNENMVLKQSAFTFEFAPTDKLNQATSPTTTNTTSSLSSAGTNTFTSPAQSGSSASPESTTSNYISKSPGNSLFNNTPSPNPNADTHEQVTVNSAGFTVFRSNSSGNSTAQPTPATPALSMSSPGAGPSSINGAFNHNSLFTSYRDTSSMYTLGLPLGDFNTLATPGLGAEFGMDFSMDMPMGNDLGAFGLGDDFDDLFGGQLGVLNGTSSYGGVGPVESPVGMVASPHSTSAPTPSPHPNPLIIDGLPSVGESARVECSIKAPGASDWRRCPKTRDEFVDLVKKDAKQATFGPPLGSEDAAKVEQEWQRLSQRPEFQEPDMEGLCHELFDKAQCTELKTRMKQSMMRIAKDMAGGSPA